MSSKPIPLAVGLMALASCLPAPAARAEVRVALLPILVHSADATSDYLSAGLADMLSSRLEHAGDLRVLRIHDAPATTVQEDAVEAARGVEAEYVVYGSFTRFGDGASLDVRCAPVVAGEGAPRRVFIQSGTLGEIIPKLDGLADKMRLYLGAGGAPEAPAVAAATAANAPTPAAYDALQRRVQALERAVFARELRRALGEPEPAEAGTGGAPEGDPGGETRGDPLR